jgi:co-chaperonin GroES (HSP10)
MVGRIIVSDKHSERTRFADVVAVGDGVKNYKPGDKIMISWYTGSHVHILEDDLFGNKPDEDLDRFVMESEILGKVID